MPGQKGRHRKRDYALDGDDDLDAMERFVDLVADGIPEVNAALEVGWSPKQLRSYMQDPDFLDLVVNARDRADGTIQGVLFNKAKEGNMMAIGMWLKSRKRAEWGEHTTVDVRSDGRATAAAVGAVKESVLAILAQVGAKQMQALPPVLDAEVVEDGDGAED